MEGAEGMEGNAQSERRMSFESCISDSGDELDLLGEVDTEVAMSRNSLDAQDSSKNVPTPFTNLHSSSPAAIRGMHSTTAAAEKTPPRQPALSICSNSPARSQPKSSQDPPCISFDDPDSSPSLQRLSSEDFRMLGEVLSGSPGTENSIATSGESTQNSGNSFQQNQAFAANSRPENPETVQQLPMHQ
eukprot:672-Rhodomonas_salina.1